MTITTLSNPLLDDATSVLIYKGPANVIVYWSVQSGPGTVVPTGDSATNGQGLAMALYTPGGGGAATAVISVTHG